MWDFTGSLFFPVLLVLGLLALGLLWYAVLALALGLATGAFLGARIVYGALCQSKTRKSNSLGDVDRLPVPFAFLVILNNTPFET